MGVALVRVDGCFLYANPHFTEITGYTCDEIKTMDRWYEKAYPDPDYRTRVKKEWSRSSSLANTVRTYDITCSNGQVKTIEFQGAFLPDEIDMITLQDISDRKDAEIAHRRSENTLKSIFNAAPTGIGVVKNRILLRVNDALCRMLGYDEKELVGKSARILYPTKEEFDYVGTAKYRQIKKWGTGTVETKWQHKSGEILKILLSSTPINVDDRTEGVTFTALDITERIRSQEAIAESEKKYRTLVETTDTGFVFLDNKGRVMDANQTYVEMTGYRHLNQILNRNLLEWTAPYDIERNLNEIEKCVSTGAVRNLEIDYITPDGDITPIEIFARTIESRSGITILTLCRDITERKQMETALKENEARYRQFFEEIISGAFISTPQGRLLDCNQEFIKILGFSSKQEALDQDYSTLYHDVSRRVEFLNQIKQCKKGVRHFESRMKKMDGSRLDVLENAVGIFDSNGQLTTIRGYLFDITDVKAMENQLRHAQKMEAVGTLVGGISHDFNNLLQAINGYAELICLEKTESDADYKNATALRQVSKRAGDLVKQLLVFSRDVKTKKKLISINKEVRQAKSLLGKTIPKMISIKTDLSESLWPANADPLQIEQVLLNLGSNAADAMPEGGSIAIKTRNYVKKEDLPDDPAGLAPGDYALLSVADTGHGMDSMTREKIFDPFFTTKELGKGTGLGLSSVYGIIKNHNGGITCKSRVGKGTVFNIYLPAFKDKIVPSTKQEPLKLEKGKETILVVDDEDAIRDFAKNILERMDYTYLEAGNGEEAIDLFKKRSSQIDLVVLDLSMPGMGGYNCLKRLLAIDKNVRVLMASGYSADTTIDDCLKSGAAGYIRKPYQLKDFFLKIREILDDSHPQ